MGKTSDKYLQECVSDYEGRIKHYISYSKEEIPDIKGKSSLNRSQIKEQEGALILKRVENTDLLILLDENGRDMSSIEFSQKLGKWSISGVKSIIFVVGGAYGFSDVVYKRADEKLSLSKMTFSHQMVRLFFAEQLYRAFTILKGEPYHHE
jgi:Uncharacterized conserved protein